MSGEDVEGVLAAHRAIVSGDEDGWHVVCTCGHREPGDSTVAHVAAAVRAEVRAWLESEGAAIRLHDAYEAAAVEQGWATQERSRVPWDDVPAENKATMRAALAALAEQVGQVAPSRVPGEGSCSHGIEWARFCGACMSDEQLASSRASGEES